MMGMVSFLFELASDYVITGWSRVILMTDAIQITKCRFWIYPERPSRMAHW